MTAPQKLQFADQQHLITLMLDAICERKSVREQYMIAESFLKEVEVTLHRNTIRTYIDQAKAIFNTPYDATREKMRINAQKRMDSLYKRCLKSDDLSTALKVEKELTLLRGVYEDIKGMDKDQVINIVFKDACKEDIEE